VDDSPVNPERVALNEWFSRTLASIGDAVIATDADGRVGFMNPVAERLTQWTLEEGRGKPLGDVFVIVNEHTRAVAENPVAKAIRTGHSVGLANHTLLIARRGTEVPIDDSAAPIRGGDGRTVGVVLVFRDITEKRRAELVRERLAAIVDSSDDIIASKTLDGIITSWNHGAERILGYAADEIIGQHVSLLMPPEFIEDMPKILDQIRRGKQVEHYETKRRRKDGTIIDVSLTVSPIRDASGAIVGASKIGRDITNQKLLELERRDGERRKDEFLAMLSHELRNPLAAIKNALALYRKTASDDDREWAIDVVSRQAQQLGKLIDDLLDVSRIAKNKISLKKETLDASAIIRQAIEATRPLVESRRHVLSCTLPPAVLLVDADAVRLEQIVVNLLTNAARYTEPGGRISVTAQRVNGEVEIRVRDTGIGISQELMPRLFDLFAQGDRSAGGAEAGLGVGLALIKSLAELHGGSVAATSAGAGKGSEFVVRLPAVATPGRAADS
jgi:PAS domain S-box-containing protein